MRQPQSGVYMVLLRALLLFTLTAVAEILGCYLPFLWLRKGAPLWFLVPAAASLSLFVWLLTLHPTAAGRTYAAYGGVYVTVAIGWLWLVEKQRPTVWDTIGAAVTLFGMAIIVMAPRQ
jgi:small multidrug resistance family-3 protein